MALGDITFEDQDGNKPSAPSFVDAIMFDGDDAYPTGGTADFVASLRGVTFDQREILGIAAQDCGAYDAVYDVANDKLKVFVRATGAEVANATDLSGTVFHIVVFSR